jgi:hypothetical protein
MTRTTPGIADMDRREAVAAAAAFALLAAARGATAKTAAWRPSMKLMCIIRYQIDPFKRDDFRKHAQNLVTVIPNAGGHLVGYFMPHEGTNDIAWGLILFDSLTTYEAYRARLKINADAVADAAWTEGKRCILREERNFVELVDGTFNLPSALA